MGQSVRLFFSHASEDKARVLQVYERVVRAHPEIKPWVDTFEITGGEALLDKIAEGMDEASRFFVFLSPISVTKPWVQAELKRALTQEIGGNKPNYVVPVKMGGLVAVPAFVESKKYIDLDFLTESEWLAEFHAAATGGSLPREVHAEPNLIVDPVSDPANPNVIQLAFRVRHWAEAVGFAIRTHEPAEDVDWAWAAGGRGGPTNYSKVRTPTEAGIALPERRITPGDDFRMTIRFAPGVNAAEAIEDLHEWDGRTAASEFGTIFR